LGGKYGAAQAGVLPFATGRSVTDLFSPGEIARAVGVSEEAVLAAMHPRRAYVSRADAVQIGVALLVQLRRAPSSSDSLFSIFTPATRTVASRRIFALSSTLHGTLLVAAIFMAGFNLAPRAAVLTRPDKPSDMMRLIFLPTAGPGGGGGGGGLREPLPAPKAMREGRHPISSPIPDVKPIVPAPSPPAPLKSEQLPTVIAPIVNSPSDARTRPGILEETVAERDAHGPGSDGGAGSGRGSGLGPGSGQGVGAGSGGGTGGGPYRPGSGIAPPRLLREVKADYTEDARRRGLSGEVVMEIVVLRDGSVGEVKILRGLGSGLDQRAVDAVRQWRFAPAERQGVLVDVLVEVAVEFKLR
jgi:periplasmic protein TonB